MKTLVGLVLALMVGVPANDSESLERIGFWMGVDLQLGMIFEQVKDKVENQGLVLERVGAVGRIWLVRTKDKPVRIFGNITFDDTNTVAVAVINWSSGEVDGFTFASALVNAVDHFIHENGNQCHLQRTNYSSPPAEMRIAMIACGNRTLEIHTTEIRASSGTDNNSKASESKKYAQIQERVSSKLAK